MLQTISLAPDFNNYTFSATADFSETSSVYHFDFFLKAGSPGKGAGTDSKDVGLNASFKLYGIPPIPQITSFKVNNPILNYGTPQGDPINATVKVSGKR